ncbi:hypothetical protein BS78_03G090500 [Paspalum vaginatum]|nr:hypothetical protein BS78_03G090500 [Paspalum vaginatum]
MAPPLCKATAAVIVVVLVVVASSPAPLQAARTAPGDGDSSSTPAASWPGTPTRPPLLPPATASSAEASRSRIMRSVPSPGVGH